MYSQKEAVAVALTSKYHSDLGYLDKFLPFFVEKVSFNQDPRLTVLMYKLWWILRAGCQIPTTSISIYDVK